MFKHYIVLSSSYSQGKRIAMDFVGLSTTESGVLTNLIDRIKKNCGNDVSISLHSVEAEGEGWAAVGKADPFFADVKLIDSDEEFIALIKKDRKLKGLDVAKYILSVIDDCTHLKLEKLTYLCYADYLCATEGERLFEDKIFAYRYGPVVQSVYETYKTYGESKIGEIDDNKKLPERKYELSARSRIIFSENGLAKLNSVTATLGRYGHMGGGALIDLTHRDGSPWAHHDSTKFNELISDKDILDYHGNEK